MDQKPNTDVVLLAVSTLYNNPDKCEKEKASQWLLELQKSVHAWSIADELLHKKHDIESCYFAAQTMRTKINQHFYELPTDVHSSLRDSILEHMSQINEGTSTIIITQLSLALADLILQMPAWQLAPLDLINSFSNTNVWPLLEVLIVLPEEWENRSVRLGENRRVEVLNDLKTCAPTVIEFLKHCCSKYGTHIHDNVHINVKILKCFASWISVGAISLQGGGGITENIVVHRAFEILSFKPDNNEKQVSGALHDAATDCICTLLQCLGDNNNEQELELYLFNNIVNLEVPYHMSVANEDQGKSMDYCRLFTELAESFIEKIISNSTAKSPHYATKVLDLVLICVGHHDYEVAEITFNLWYALSEEVYQKNNKELTEMFRPYVERLIAALCRHCQMEPDYEGVLEDDEEFKDFRLKVVDMIKDVVYIVGSSSLFRQMFISLQTPGVTWDASEAALFVMQAVAKNVLPTENEVVPKVVEAILTIPENTHIAVRYTAVLLLGELCEWIEKHPTTLDPILNFLVYGLSQPGGVGTAAATALENICITCSAHMARHMPILLQLLHQVGTLSISNSAILGLLKGVASIVGSMPHQDVSGVMKELCLMQVTPLCQAMEQDMVANTIADPVLWLDRLSAVFRHVCIILNEGEVHPCRAVILDVWPVLSRVFDKYQSHVRVMERCCRTVRFMLRCVSQQLRDLLDSLVSQMMRIYTEHKHSCFLYVGSILVDEYAKDTDCIQGLLDMLQGFLEPTFRLLQEENGLRNNPDTVDDFFRMCARFLQRVPISFLQCPAIMHIIECGLLATSLDHKEANISVMKFFYDLINQALTGRSHHDFEQRKALVISILNQYGQHLVTNLIHACVFCLHPYMLSDVADVFIQLLDFDRDMTSKLLAEGLDVLPKHNSNGIVTATPEQLNDVHKSIIRSDSTKSVTHALKDLTKLYR